jgi:V/A-type H+-transporting ATPase subunit C
MNNTSAEYAYTRVKYQENKLIGAERLNRMLSAKSCEEAFKILQETSYAENASASGCADFAQISEAEKGKLINFFKEVCPDENAKACFLKEYDYHNAKAFVKEKYHGEGDFGDVIYNYGLIEPKFLKDCIKNENYADLPAEMAEALSNIDIGYASYGINPRQWELELDKALSADTAKHAAKCRYRAVKDYFVLKTDTENLLSAVKFRALGFGAAQLNEQFLSGGSVDFGVFAESLNSGVETAADFFKNTHIYALAQNGFKNFDKTGITYFEKEAEVLLSGYFGGLRQEIETVYPLLDFFLKKLAEIKNINLIFSAMLGGASAEEITGRTAVL